MKKNLRLFKNILKKIPLISTSTSPSDAIWTLQDFFLRFLKLSNKLYFNEKINKELFLVKNHGNDVSISIILTVRKLRNRDSNLPEFINSIIRTCENQTNIEVIIRTDFNDLQAYYMQIIRTTTINMSVIFGNQGAGYFGTHVMQQENFKHISKSSKIVVIATDDSRFIEKNWDSKLLSAYHSKKVSHKHDLYMFFPNRLDETTLWISGESGERWMAGADFPIITVSTLKKIEDFTNRKNLKGWTVFGNLPNVDSYFADILAALPKTLQSEVHSNIGPIIVRGGKTSYTDPRWPLQVGRFQKRLKMLEQFNSSESVSVREMIAKSLEDTILKARSN